MMKALWSKAETSFGGEYYRVAVRSRDAVPVQRPHPRSSSAGAADGCSAAPPGRPTSSGSIRAWRRAISVPRSSRPPRAEYYQRRLAWIRQAAGSRFKQLELQCLTFLVQMARPREEAVARLAGACRSLPSRSRARRWP